MIHKQHKITTIKQLFDIANKNNVNTLIKDLSISIECFIELRDIHPSIEYKQFIWIDDGKNDINLKITEK